MSFVQKLANDESDSDTALGIAATFSVANFCTRLQLFEQIPPKLTKSESVLPLILEPFVRRQ